MVTPEDKDTMETSGEPSIENPTAEPDMADAVDQNEDGAGFIPTAERVPLFSWGPSSAPSLPSIDSDEQWVSSVLLLMLESRGEMLPRVLRGCSGHLAVGSSVCMAELIRAW